MGFIIGEEERRKHDPANSFDDVELAGLMTFMEIPLSFWADLAKKSGEGTADVTQLEEWKRRLDSIKPGMGEAFLGGVNVNEEEWLSRYNGSDGLPRAPINYTKNGEKRYGDLTHGMFETYEDWLKSNGYDVVAVMKRLRPGYEETRRTESEEEYEARKKLIKAKYDAEMAELELERVRSKTS